MRKSAVYSVRHLKRRGVIIFGNNVVVHKTVVVERGAMLCDPCCVTGKSKICSGARIMPFSCIEDSTICARTVVLSSSVSNSYVAEDCSIGPYACLRAGANVGRGCRVGDFVEIKNSSLAEGCKAAHLSYIGDADLGREVNIGCGVVFANYDGKVKSRTRVGDCCFIGCNCNIVAPVFIGSGAYIAAGTTVTRDLEPMDFCIGRCREEVKPGGGAGRYKDGQILRN